MTNNLLYNNTKGYITLMAVLVIGAIALSVTTGLLLSGISSSRSSFAYVQSAEAQKLADACVEEALWVIHENTTYVGTSNLSLGQGSCTYTVTNQGGDNRTIASSGSIGTIIRKVEVTINAITPKINITSWQEVADF